VLTVHHRRSIQQHPRERLAGELRTLIGYFGPRIAEAGLIGTIWPVISQSNSILTAASCCFTSGAEWVS